MRIEEGLRQIADTSLEVAKKNPGDYEIDGILHCGTCHKPKRMYITIPFGEKILAGVMCDCEQTIKRARDKERAERLFEARQAVSFGSADKAKAWRFDNSEKTESIIIAKNYADNAESFFSSGKGFTLCGDSGCGKTRAVCALANQLIRQGYSVMFTSLSDLATEAITKDRKAEYIQDARSVDFLILDDLGTERQTDWMREFVYTTINGRYMGKRPLIVTTNLSADKLKNPDDMSNKRTYDRLLEISPPYKVTGGNKRYEQIRQDYKGYMEILTKGIKEDN